MSDDTTPDPTPDDTPDGQPSDSTDQLGDAGKAAIKAERDRANQAEKALKALQAQHDEIAAKATAFEAAAQETAAALAAKDLAITRLNVGLDKGLPKELLSRLQGDDEASLSADADQLLKLLGAKPSTPRPDPSQGAKAPGGTSVEQQFVAVMDGLFNNP